MRLRLAIAAALACTGFVTIAPTVGHALVELDITALPVDRYSMGAGFDPETNKPVFEDQPLALEALPMIVVVIDEMADLMIVAGKEIEAAVQSQIDLQINPTVIQPPLPWASAAV